MPAVNLNETRVWNVEAEVNWRTGTFVIRGEIARDPDTLARFVEGERLSIDGRVCRGRGKLEDEAGQVVIRGDAFPWRRDEWAATALECARGS